MSKIEEAREFAARWHEGQTDKSGDQYMGHVQRVANSVSHLSEDHQIVALLHDVLEDTPAPLPQIFRRFGTRVGTAVCILTKHKDLSYEQYLETVKTDEISLAVKIADVRDNIDPERIARLDAADQLRLCRKYHNALSILAPLPTQ